MALVVPPATIGRGEEVGIGLFEPESRADGTGGMAYAENQDAMFPYGT